MRFVGAIYYGFLLLIFSIFPESKIGAQDNGYNYARLTAGFESRVVITDTIEKPVLKKVLRELHEQYGIFFLFADPDLGSWPVNRVSGTSKDVDARLDAILKATGLGYRKSNSTTYIIVLNEEEQSRTKSIGRISGQILNRNNEPIPGASIRVKGTQRGATADAMGRFSVDAVAGDILIVSSIAFQQREINVVRNNIDIVLDFAESEMEEVTVVALGITRNSRSLGYSVTKLAGSRIQLARENNLANSISGWIAGLNSSAPQTGPGASSRVSIRGNSSLSFDNQPLYVVNGIPINNDNLGSAGKFGGADFGDGISSINPDDVESLQVLKGSAAAALYGQRGRNGVVLVETKKAGQHERTRVTIDQNTQFDHIREFTNFQKKYGQGFQGEAPGTKEEALNAGLYSWGAPLDGRTAVYFDGISRPYRLRPGNNLRKFYDTGIRLSQTLAIDAGNEQTQWRFSIGDLRSNSVYPNARFNRQTANIDLNYQISKRWSGSSYLQYSREQGRNRPNVNDAPGNGNFAILFLPPNVDAAWLKPGYDANGYEIRFNDNAFNTNPYFAASRFKNNTDRDRIWGMTQIRFQWTKKLSVQGRLAHDFFSFRASSITPTGTAYKPEGTVNLERSYDYHETNADLLARYDMAFDANWGLQLVAGANVLRMRARVLDVAADGLAFPFLYSPTNASANSVSRLRPQKNVHSVYGSVQLDWRKTAYLSITDRNDWSSTLPEGKNSYNYPSASLSYLLSNHLNWKWLHIFRLRAAYARVGGDAPLFATQLYYTSTGTISGTPIGSMESQIPNNALEPLQVREWEWGFEAGALKNRVHLDLAFYQKETLNDIVAATVSVASGYRSAVVNVGRIVNRGVEVQLTLIPIQRKHWSWTSEMNLAWNRNNVKQLYRDQVAMQVANGESRTERAFIQHVVGRPFAQIMVYDVRRNAEGIPVLANSGLQPGTDLVAAGTAIHPLTGGWWNRVQWKNWSFDWLIDFKAGGFIYSGTEAVAIQRGLDPRTLHGRENGVLVKGVNSSGGPAIVNLTAQQYYESLYRISAMQVQDASFVKMRSFSLSYCLPDAWTKKWCSAASVSLVGRNLFYFYKRTRHIDPEANYTHSNAQGLENGSLPALRSIGVHFKIQFN